MKHLFKRNPKSKFQKAFALTEVLLSIAVVIILGITGYHMYKESREQADIQTFLGYTVALKKTIETNFINQTVASTGYQNFNQMITNMKLVPEGMTTVDADGNQEIGYKDYSIAAYIGTNSLGKYTFPDPHGMLYVIGSAQPNAINLSAEQCIDLIKGVLPLYSNVILGFNNANKLVKADGHLSIGIDDIVNQCKALTPSGWSEVADGMTVIYASDSPFSARE